MTDVKKLFIKTYGCQMNVYDSERMAEAMGAEGYVLTETAEDADMVLLNTCHIREKASEKLYSDLGRLKPLKQAKPGMKIGVAGCVAQAEGDAQRFKSVLVEYQRAPAVTRDRLYLETMQQVFSNVSKVLVDSRAGSNLLYLPLDKLIQMSGSNSNTSTGVPATVETPNPTAPPPAAADSRSRDGARTRDREGR